LLFALLDEQRPHFPIQTNAGWQAVAFFAVIAAGKWTWLQRVLSWPALTRIGGASYSIYLVHEPIVSALVAGLRPRIGDAAATGAAIAAGVAAGFVLWAIVERPLTRPDFVARFVERGRARVERLFETAGVARFFDVRRPAETIATVTLAETRFAFVEIGTATSPDGPPRRTRGPSPLESGLAIVLFASLCAGSALAQSTTTSSSGVQVIDMNPVAPAPAAPRRKGGPRSGAKPPRSGNESSSAAALLKTALSYVGTPFVMGGTSPSGFDCSGFVQFAYASIGIHIPRTADQQFYAGRQIAGDPLPGDLLFFQTYEYGPSHVAIYLGNDQFVNAIGKDVHVASFSSDYFRSRYLGARRFLPD
jgi:cell wall-associated NlpC family hydrolase